MKVFFLICEVVCFNSQYSSTFRIDTYYKPYVDGLVDDLYDLVTRDDLEFIK